MKKSQYQNVKQEYRVNCNKETNINMKQNLKTYPLSKKNAISKRKLVKK